MEFMIEGVKVIVEALNLNTGEIKPFVPEMQRYITKNVVDHMTPEQINALPRAPKGTKPDLILKMTPSGRKIWSFPEDSEGTG